ncbi:MAG: amino-acid N-acetyltransferase [Candidatus Binatota bacterium]|nr:amino-acid N-acetyltransferase [Candidatus Binatota bacterium]
MYRQMAVGARIVESAGDDLYPEKRFYLDEFHEKTLFFAIDPRADDPGALDEFLAIVRELIREDVRVVVMVGDRDVARRLEQRFHRFAAASLSEPLFPGSDDGKRKPSIQIDVGDGEEGNLTVLLRVWGLLRAGPIAILRVPHAEWPRLLACAVTVAARLRVHKLVLVDAEGGIGRGAKLSFLDENMLGTLLSAGEAESAGLGDRRKILEAIREGLRGGIPAINLCTLSGVGLELYTYEGSGTLFTFEDYCCVERLGIDDFREVERLLERGQREGFLKLRSPGEIGQILLTGYGATIGSGYLAGVGSLLSEPYREERAGEVVALYTISRFKNEGVGTRILGRILEDARAAGLTGVFACTTQERAMQFFARHGFRRVSPAGVPAAKWHGYDPERICQLAIFRKELESA